MQAWPGISRGRRLALLLAAAAVAALLTAPPAGAGIAGLLDELGGEPCPQSEFTCVTLTVPLDHFDPTDGRTIDVVFAVLPATGTSKGLFVTATGGPGTAGISYADDYTSYFASSVRRRFDIVFFDQRGIGLSGGLTCPEAYGEYLLSDAAPDEAASRFSGDCVAEMGNPAILPYVGTAQAVEDLEDFRLAVGSPRMWLYGESYGTQYAEEYAAAHGQALDGLILDGTVDLTLSGPEFWAEAAAGFEDVLGGTLASCDRRARCRADAGGSSAEVYDELARRLEESPLSVRFPLPSGGTAVRPLTLAYLETAASGQLYNEGDRMLLQRAIAAAGRGDLVPLLRLAYANLYVDPGTFEPVVDPTYSDAMYYGVDCQDYSYYSGSPDERAAQYVEDAAAVDAQLPRVGAAVFLSDLPCVFWPGAIEIDERPAPLRADGVPTLVLAATGDPITPVGMGERVFRRLADGYLVVTNGGPHVTFGRGNPCPDELVTRFLVEGAVPRKREGSCPGHLVDAYVGLAPRSASGFRSLRAALASAETELYYLPEYYYWDGFTPTPVGCPAGGGTVRMTGTATQDRFAFRGCGFTRGVVMTGRGSYDYDRDRFVLDVSLAGRWHGHVRYVREGGRATVDQPEGRAEPASPGHLF
jgi:pimeloyl-ACP methyl ester carboxylesterase